ncbi:3-oxoacyl-(acyl-carrier-protein) reductase [Paracidovorax avenae ATCC 19860]|uniref:3-oxoacyl-(Acyl-carrier-protein) reductase n=1 Tax=Paracidovorax avenae (strain ATCC 19860 / DSM 7227 / CCUG 15838 / JCM 20985 / LMG 2117 / NCPPB 1011) TaxID=643561 RepID=F0Q7S8_PARA1|nr:MULTISPECIES: SDR family oxidoreductase [Comamonadaceae]ADX48260.1 3-oxoacyl-(acyl-carrier-protein) reductase [Paracidovorax avenae ATCC 19860]AVS65659.1 SDR family NAD(P)-dependent oxidoreductase [Paracidovorax avenae]MDA8452811.1 SDR family oxidoreductase [Acidovorax sp. GBBC 3297]MDA8462216.1 SDR family oxidoreductase [Acidovorax sp. GBBC 3333]MDA8467252.1 SDR family oxidoreductase [Acidovorax sp. GBBC 3332]
MPLDPRTAGPRPPFKDQQPLTPPGAETDMHPQPDYGAASYQGSGRLQGRRAVITGGDSGIGRAVALAFAREGADVLIAYLPEEEGDARKTLELVTAEGRRAVGVPGDIREEAHCNAIIERAVKDLGGIDILVNNAAYQMAHESIDEISAEEFDRTFRTNVYATFYLSKAAARHMPPGSAIINTVSVNADKPNKTLLAYASTKGALQNFTGGLAQLLADKGIRVNCVAPGPVWTPLIPSTMPIERAREFGKQVPLQRPGQPAEVAPAYVMLASDQASFISGATVAVTGGVPII